MSVVKFKRPRKKYRRLRKRGPSLLGPMKYLLPAMLAFGLPIIWLYSTVDLSASKPESAQLLRVIDGDTVEIRMANRGEVRIRLSGVDAPERDQPYGSQSTRCLKEIMRGGDLNVRLKKRIGTIAGWAASTLMVNPLRCAWQSRDAPGGTQDMPQRTLQSPRVTTSRSSKTGDCGQVITRFLLGMEAAVSAYAHRLSVYELSPIPPE